MIYAVVALAASLGTPAVAPTPTPTPAFYRFEPFPPTPRAHPVFPPRPPAGLHFVGPVTNGRIRLQWDASRGAASYRVYFELQPAAGIYRLEGGAPRLASVVPVTYADLAPGCYAVSAANVAGQSQLSARVCAPSQLRPVFPRPGPTAAPSSGPSTLRIFASPQRKLGGVVSGLIHLPANEKPSAAPCSQLRIVARAANGETVGRAIVSATTRAGRPACTYRIENLPYGMPVTIGARIGKAKSSEIAWRTIVLAPKTPAVGNRFDLILRAGGPYAMMHAPFGVPNGVPYNGGGSWPISVSGYAPVPMQFQPVTFPMNGGGTGQHPLPSDYSQFCGQYRGRASACLFFPANSNLTVMGGASANETKDVEATDPTCTADGGIALLYGNNQTGCAFVYPALFNARVVQPSSTNWGYGSACSPGFDVEMNGSTGVLTVRYPTAAWGSTMTTGAQPLTCVVWVLVAHPTLPRVKER